MAWGKPERSVNLFEHNEWMATDCPSDRIPWDRLIADLEEQMPEVDWPKEKLALLQDFLDWWEEFPDSQEAKDDTQRQHEEETYYRNFFDRQIAWRSPPR